MWRSGSQHVSTGFREPINPATPDINSSRSRTSSRMARKRARKGKPVPTPEIPHPSSTAAVAQASRPRVGFWSLPPEICHMIWDQALSVGVIRYEKPPASITDFEHGRPVLLDNSDVVFETDFFNDLFGSLAVSQLLSVKPHPISQLCGDARTFAITHARDRIISAQSVAVVSSDPLCWSCGYTRSCTCRHESLPIRSASVLRHLPLIALRATFFEKPPRRSHAYQDILNSRIYGKSLRERFGLIERQSKDLDQKLMLLYPASWTWRIRYDPLNKAEKAMYAKFHSQPSPPEFDNILFHWRHLSRQGGYIIDLEDTRTFQELKELFLSCFLYSDSDSPVSGETRKARFGTVPPMIERILSGPTARRAVRREAMAVFSRHILRETNARRRKEGLRPFVSENIRVGVEFGLRF